MSRAAVRRVLGAGVSVTALVAVVGACSSDASSESGIAVKATNDECEVENTSFDAGKVTFNVKNDGSKVTEVYVYGRNGDDFNKVISEVENIGPGTSRDMTVTLSVGTYEIACKPGQTGDGIRQRVTVGGGAATGTTTTDTAAAYDREIELSTDGTTISGLTGASAKGATGEKVEIKLENKAAGERTLEIKDPSGTVAGEVEIEAGSEGELVVELATAGTWQVIVEGGSADVIGELVVS